MAKAPAKKTDPNKPQKSGKFSLMGLMKIISVIGMIACSAILMAAFDAKVGSGHAPEAATTAHGEENTHDAGKESEGHTDELSLHDVEIEHGEAAATNHEEKPSHGLMDTLADLYLPAYGAGVFFFILFVFASRAPKPQAMDGENVAAGPDPAIDQKLFKLSERIDQIDRGALHLLTEEFEKVKGERLSLSAQIEEIKQAEALKLEDELNHLRIENAKLHEQISSMRGLISPLEAAQ